MTDPRDIPEVVHVVLSLDSPFVVDAFPDDRIDGDHLPDRERVVDYVPAAARDAAVARAERAEAKADHIETLYYDAVITRSKYGFTVNHLLECEGQLRAEKERAERAEATLQRVAALVDASWSPEGEHLRVAQIRAVLAEVAR